MKIEFFYEFMPPQTTNQQRRQNRTGGYLHSAGRIAKATWQAVLEKERPQTPLVGALALECSLTWPHTVKSAREAQKHISQAFPKTTRPDGDNLIKMIKDGMQSCGYFHDDAQIFDERITRWHGSIPGVYIKIEEVQTC